MRWKYDKKYDAWDHVGEQNGNLGYNESSTVAKACEIKVMIEEVGHLGHLGERIGNLRYNENSTLAKAHEIFYNN